MTLYRQLLTRNSCYTSGKKRKGRGVMVHSTGANNPNLSRYVPGDEVIGCNTGGNHWDQSNAEWKRKYGKNLDKCVHAFIGRTADGTVATVQTLPWDMRGWHAGKSEGNDQYIGFEICEDGLDDPTYFASVYREAVELTAYLCKMECCDPMEDGVVICHAEGCKRGVASNHGDVLHWFCRHGKSMDDFRADVMAEMEDEMTQEQFDKMMDKYLARRAALPAGAWDTKNLLAEAVKMGITDGKRPEAWATRHEVALMVRAAVYAD